MGKSSLEDLGSVERSNLVGVPRQNWICNDSLQPHRRSTRSLRGISVLRPFSKPTLCWSVRFV